MDDQNGGESENGHLLLEIVHILALTALKSTLLHLLGTDECLDAGFKVHISRDSHA